MVSHPSKLNANSPPPQESSVCVGRSPALPKASTSGEGVLNGPVPTPCATRALRVVIAACALGWLAGPVQAAPQPKSPDARTAKPHTPMRCGWFHNPTPGNASLVDPDGEWVLGVQGGHQADGDWPVFPRRHWRRTNGSYGYGCACLRVTADPASLQVLQIHAASARPLKACQDDRRLPPP